MVTTEPSPTHFTHAHPAPGSTPQLPRRAFGYALTGTAATLLLMAASAPSPFYPMFQQRLDISPVGITLVFAVYAIALLVALLTVGSLSDNIGRRPVISTGFALLAVSMLMLWHADSGTVLFLARAVQGLASGILLSALSASVTDFAPPSHPQNAALLNSIAPMTGLALGAVFGGTMLDLGSDAAAAVFGSLALAYLLIAAAIWFVPETSVRVAGWRRALRPRAAVPITARRMFLLSVPIIVAGWATGGLFFSLGADIVAVQLHVTDHLAQGIIIGALPAAGALAVLALHRRTPRTTTVYGALALAVGTLLSLIALGFDSSIGYLVAVAITGTGFGAGFMGVIGSLTPTVALHQRAELFAALYTVSYLAFGIPTVIAGGLVSLFSLSTTTVWYGTFVIVFAAGAAIFRYRERDPR